VLPRAKEDLVNKINNLLDPPWWCPGGAPGALGQGRQGNAGARTAGSEQLVRDHVIAPVMLTVRRA